MTLDQQLADIDPCAYEPYRDPRDYILSWTDAIWIDRGLGRLTEHYDRNVKVHTAYGETYDWDFVVSNSWYNMGGKIKELTLLEPRPAN